jgi:protein-disulfide isomerase
VAAECAHQQGRFWEYRRELFASENGLMLDSLKLIAEKISLNINQFEVCIKSSNTQNRVEQDIFVAESLGATGTPTFFINDKVLVGARSFELFKIFIDEELEKYEN